MELSTTYRKKKTIGILGGMGPAATANLYNELIALAQQQYGAKQDHEFPQMILNSLPLVDWNTTGFLDLNSVKTQLINGVKMLERAGSDFIIIGCNTVHHFYDEMQRAVNIPIINMVEKTVERVRLCGYHKVAVLATESNLRLRIYQKALEHNRIENVELRESEKKQVTGVIAHAEAGRLSYEDTLVLKQMIHRAKADGAEAIILGCTELPLAITQSDVAIELFNSTMIITEAALAYSFKPEMVVGRVPVRHTQEQTRPLYQGQTLFVPARGF